MRKLKLSFSGSKNHKQFIINSLGDKYQYIDDDDYKNADLIYRIYGIYPNMEYENNFIFLKKRIIIHWIGTDVLRLIERSKRKRLNSKIKFEIWKYLFNRAVKNGYIINFACAPWLVDELKSLGIKSEYLPITSIDKSKIESENYTQNLKRQYDFMSYVPTNRFNFYGGKYIIKLAKILKNSKFLLIHPDISDNENIENQNYPENVKVVKRLSFDEMPKMYNDCKFFLRFPEHDGLSLSVIESMGYGLQVFWNYKFPHTIHINLGNFESEIEKIKSAVEKWEYNESGKQYVLENYNSETCKALFNSRINQLFNNNERV